MKIMHVYQRRPTHLSRRGVAFAESALVLPVVIFMLFAMLDLSLAVVRYNALAHVSRKIAREAIIHGNLAPAVMGSWGPEAYEGSVDDGVLNFGSLEGYLPTMSSDRVTAKVSWPDNDNAPRNRVRVELSFRHEPLIPTLFPWGPLDLHVSTTMRIVN